MKDNLVTLGTKKFIDSGFILRISLNFYRFDKEKLVNKVKQQLQSIKPIIVDSASTLPYCQIYDVIV